MPEKMENMNKSNKIIFHNKNEDNALFLLEFKFSYFFLVADSGGYRRGATGTLHPPDGFRGGVALPPTYFRIATQ